MKVTIYSIPSANGLIAPTKEDDYGFITDQAWALYLKTLKKAGVFVMGRKTYEVSLRTGAFPYDCFNVVMTKQKFENKWADKVIFSAQNPKQLLDSLSKKGFKQVIVTGGHLSSSFMKDKLVNELWLHLMPTVFANGINVFEGESFTANLKLFDLIQSANDEVLIKYKVRY